MFVWREIDEETRVRDNSRTVYLRASGHLVKRLRGACERMGHGQIGTHSSQMEIPNGNFPVFFVNGKRPLFTTTNFNTYSPVQTAQRSSHVVDRSSHDRSTISATATSKFTTTTASPAEQLIADIVTLFVRSKL